MYSYYEMYKPHAVTAENENGTQTEMMVNDSRMRHPETPFDLYRLYQYASRRDGGWDASDDYKMADGVNELIRKGYSMTEIFAFFVDYWYNDPLHDEDVRKHSPDEVEELKHNEVRTYVNSHIKVTSELSSMRERLQKKHDRQFRRYKFAHPIKAKTNDPYKIKDPAWFNWPDSNGNSNR